MKSMIQESYSIDINSLRKECDQVFKEASILKYGCLDENGNRIVSSPFKDSWQMIAEYHSQSIKSINETKLGTCFEHSLYIASLLKNKGLPHQTFFLNMFIPNEQNQMNEKMFWHQFTIVPNDTESIVLIETALKPDKNGVFLVKDMDDAVQHLIQSFNINLSEEELINMKQDLIDISDMEPVDGLTYLGYINNVYASGKHIKNDINVKKKLKLMKIYFDYLMNNECLTDTGMKIGKQVVDLDERTSFDPTLLPTIPQVTTDKGKELNKDEVYQHIIELTPKQLESKLNKVVLESYNDLNNKFHYIPLTKKTAKQYSSQGIFKYGLNKVYIDDDTKGVIYIDESHVVVGYVAIKKKINGDRWIIGLEVSQEYQNHGYGVDLLNIAVNEFGVTFLTVNKNDEDSIRMYKQNGWEIYKESDRSFYMRKV